MIDFIEKNENLMEACLRNLKKERKPVVLFGAEDCGRDYYEIMKKNDIEVLCFCDDDLNKQGREFMGKKVISVNDLYSLKSDFYILISSYGPEKLLNRLKRDNSDLVKSVILTDFYLFENGLDYYKFILQNEKEIINAYNLLADEKSRKTFRNLLNYKISRNLELIKEIREDVSLQYFDPDIIHFNKEEVYLDLGAYIGDTVLSFNEKVQGKYKKMIALEPDEKNYKRLIENTKHLNHLQIIQKGTHSSITTLRFSESGTWTSSIDPNGNKEIEVCTVDSLAVEQRITFIKADIEGAELETINGAKATIVRDKPKLAFSAYHKKEDIFHLIHVIRNINSNYKFYLRHYTENAIDTVLYAI